MAVVRAQPDRPIVCATVPKRIPWLPLRFISNELPEQVCVREPLGSEVAGRESSGVRGREASCKEYKQCVLIRAPWPDECTIVALQGFPTPDPASPPATPRVPPPHFRLVSLRALYIRCPCALPQIKLIFLTARRGMVYFPGILIGSPPVDSHTEFAGRSYFIQRQGLSLWMTEDCALKGNLRKYFRERRKSELGNWSSGWILWRF